MAVVQVGEWEPRQKTDWRKINGAIKQSYTPTIHEEGYFLRATASYKQTFTGHDP